jgi:hypothetical protein
MRVQLLLLCLLFASLINFTAVSAQDDAEAIEYGDTVDGEITSDEYEVFYSFEGEEDDLILIEMFAEPGTFDLDPALVLLDEDEDEIAANDTFPNVYFASVVVYQLEDSGTFYIGATRAFGEEGSSEGDYVLRLSLIEPAELDTSLDTTIVANSSDPDTFMPTFVVLMPEDETTVEITFDQEQDDEMFAGVFLAVIDPDAYGGVDMMVDVSETQGLSSLNFLVELENNEIYILWAQTSPSLFLFEETEIDITLTLEEQ